MSRAHLQDAEVITYITHKKSDHFIIIDVVGEQKDKLAPEVIWDGVNILKEW